MIWYGCRICSDPLPSSSQVSVTDLPSSSYSESWWHNICRVEIPVSKSGCTGDHLGSWFTELLQIKWITISGGYNKSIGCFKRFFCMIPTGSQSWEPLLLEPFPMDVGAEESGVRKLTTIVRRCRTAKERGYRSRSIQRTILQGLTESLLTWARSHDQPLLLWQFHDLRVRAPWSNI